MLTSPGQSSTRGAAKLLKGNPCLDELIELDLRGWRKGPVRLETFAAIRRTAGRLRRPGFDLALDFQGLIKSALIPWLARIPRRIGFERGALREPLSALMLTEQVEADDADHVIKKNLRLAAHLGCELTGEYDFPIEIEPEDELFAGRQHDRFDGSFAILNPGGGWPTKLWRGRFRRSRRSPVGGLSNPSGRNVWPGRRRAGPIDHRAIAHRRRNDARFDAQTVFRPRPSCEALHRGRHRADASGCGRRNAHRRDLRTDLFTAQRAVFD